MSIIGDVMDNQIAVKQADTMSPDDLAYVLAHKAMITKWLEKVEAQAVEAVKCGAHLPGLKMVESQTRRAWSKDVDQDTLVQHLLSCGLPDNKCYTTKVISPSQAQKILGNNFKDLNEYVVKPKGEPRITDENDKRPAMSLSVEDEFNDD
jgi:hypothetical protein